VDYKTNLSGDRRTKAAMLDQVGVDDRVEPQGLLERDFLGTTAVEIYRNE